MPRLGFEPTTEVFEHPKAVFDPERYSVAIGAQACILADDNFALGLTAFSFYFNQPFRDTAYVAIIREIVLKLSLHFYKRSLSIS
jgi:hypothetical protein